MSVLIHIEDDGTITARHNSGRELWEYIPSEEGVEDVEYAKSIYTFIQTIGGPNAAGGRHD